jgi:hypothetical protein
VAFDGWDAGALGFYELQARGDAVLMNLVSKSSLASPLNELPSTSQANRTRA